MPYASNEGVRIHYEVLGSGPPLFLHIGAGREWDSWKLAGYPERLKEYRLIIPDPRGRGLSDRPRTLAAHRLENYVSDVVSIVDDQGVDRVGFWGHSDGARVGFVLALKHPNRLKALVAAGGQDEPGEYEKWRVSLAGRARARGMGPLDEFFRRKYLRAFGHGYPEWYKRTRRFRDPEMFALNMLAWKDWIERWDMYPRIRVPSLIIAGDKEDPAGLGHRIASLMPDARSVVIEGEDHVGEYLRSDLVLRHVRPFLQAHFDR